MEDFLLCEVSLLPPEAAAEVRVTPVNFEALINGRRVVEAGATSGYFQLRTAAFGGPDEVWCACQAAAGVGGPPTAAALCGGVD